MSDPHSTTPTPSDKPAKPYPDFPLTAHPTRRWCKKINGKLYYFGRWKDPEGVLARYNAVQDDLHAGRTPRPDFIMGHEVPRMSAVYRETISDECLQAVTDHVRRWLFGEVPMGSPI